MKAQTLAILSSFALVATACGGSETPVEKPMPKDDAPPAATVEPIPEGLTAITASLVVPDVDEALAFYAEALGATTKFTLPGPDGRTMHGEMVIGDSTVMLSVENVEAGAKSPKTLGGTNGSLLVYVEDVDAAFKTAVEAGATATMPVADMFWGDRYGGLVDRYGHMWGLATHKEDISSEEMQKRSDAWIAAMMAGKKYETPAVVTPAKSWKADGYATVTVTLLLNGNADGVDFYAKALGAEVTDKVVMPDGKLMHASLKIGGTIVHLSSEFPEMSPTHKSAASLGGSPVSVMHYVKDVDAGFKGAVAAGGVERHPVTDMFWGDRWGMLTDPSGNQWGIATHKKKLTKEQMLEGMKAQFGAGAQ